MEIVGLQYITLTTDLLKIYWCTILIYCFRIFRQQYSIQYYTIIFSNAHKFAGIISEINAEIVIYFITQAFDLRVNSTFNMQVLLVLFLCFFLLFFQTLYTYFFVRVPFIGVLIRNWLRSYSLKTSLTSEYSYYTIEKLRWASSKYKDKFISNS